MQCGRVEKVRGRREQRSKEEEKESEEERCLGVLEMGTGWAEWRVGE
jgi:hypothetical protein